MSDDEESVRQEALAEEQFLLVELPAALRKIRAKAKETNGSRVNLYSES